MLCAFILKQAIMETGMILEVTGKGARGELGLEVLNINDLSPYFLLLKTPLKGTNQIKWGNCGTVAWGKYDTGGAILVHLFYSFQETQFLRIFLLKSNEHSCIFIFLKISILKFVDQAGQKKTIRIQSLVKSTKKIQYA